MEDRCSNILLIAGTGRNVGKTLLACQLITQFSNEHDVVAIKISPHFHNLSEQEIILVQQPNFMIVEEHQRHTGKNSARMLSAGAKKVYYLQVKDDHLTEAWMELKRFLPRNCAIICESGGLRDVLEPGLFLMVHKKGNHSIKPRALTYKEIADRWVEFDGHSLNIHPEEITYSNKGWKVKQKSKAYNYDIV